MTKSKRRENKKSRKRWLHLTFMVMLLLLMVIGGFATQHYYKLLRYPNVNSKQEIYEVNVPTGLGLNQLIRLLHSDAVIIDSAALRFVIELRRFETIKPGKYFIPAGINNWDLVALLRAGEHKPVRLVIKHYRLRRDLIQRVSNILEVDSNTLNALLEDPVYLRQYGLTPETATSIIIPNSYDFYWNTNATQFFERMLKEYQSFWSVEKLQKADSLGLSQLEIITLASIVQEETRKADEMSRIAGVYLNRLKKNWPLEADPTLKFAADDWTMRRVLKKHKKISSPYNTYKNKGLPPGPICIPEIPAIKAVLNAEKHEYMFFCAREDFSGYHNFARNLREHSRNARKFHAALNKKKIYK